LDTELPADRFDEFRDVQVIVSGWWRHGKLSDWPNLRAFMEVGGGLPSPNSLDYQTAFERQIRVLSCSPAFGPIVAEMGLGLALAAARQIARTDREFRTGNEGWSHREFRGEFSLYGKTVGFIGYGGLGRCLRKLLEPWGVHVLAYDPWMTEPYLASLGLEPCALDELMKRSDVSFILATPSKDNLHLISKERLARIPDGRVIVVLSRAHLIDFEALTAEVLSERIFAGIDVFPEEPFDPQHPIRTASHAVLSSHRAGAQLEALQRIGEVVSRDLEAVLSGLPPREMLSAEPEYLTLRG
jgi:phosphoglycerate dehydrogenase-like enzyme